MIYRWLVGVVLLFAILLLMLPSRNEKLQKGTLQKGTEGLKNRH